ncbi:MAG: FAD-binding oxidoreductase [Planctomycetes bacterium]|nr:FAD-binding oxidoreductase [Planctomycetota bacterium]
MNGVARPANAAELAELLRSKSGPVRLRGNGSRADRVPPAATGTIAIELRNLATIDRLDAADFTCSVDAGLDRSTLDDELAARGVELPCAGAGTLGGLFASDPIGATMFGGASPRSLLLGLEGVLADGTRFRSGARVVKSVAGFDVHRLLVGSHGTLFAATRLHLRLRARPRAAAWFRNDALDEAGARTLFVALRGLAVPPAALHWRRDARGHTVAGCIAGRANHVAATMRAHHLREGAPFVDLHLQRTPGGEVLGGIVLPSRVPALLAAAPPDAPFLVHGGGRFEIGLSSPAESDAFVAAAPRVPCEACILLGEPARRRRGTPIDPGQSRIAAELKRALDPDGILV